MELGNILRLHGPLLLIKHLYSAIRFKRSKFKVKFLGQRMCMEPRLSTSRKWTPLPEELIKQIRSVFKQNFKAQIGTGSIEANGKIFPEEIMVSVGFREKDALK